VSSRSDEFFAIPCTVKHKHNVQESLLSFVEEETLDGDNKYQCDDCKCKVAAIKRTRIESLPQTLILHLKRIEFDMEIFERTKINDHYVFPHDLSMYDYMLEAKPDPNSTEPPPQCDPSYYNYKLSGILCHK
jgi:ubiquitin carboxyl-terminal hydrolase 34